jgi:hypothetical protein
MSLYAFILLTPKGPNWISPLFKILMNEIVSVSLAFEGNMGLITKTTAVDPFGATLDAMFLGCIKFIPYVSE